jgi:murein L,D-transpeptidase YcbB/YkuD
MIRRLIIASGAVAAVFLATGPLRAEPPASTESVASPAPESAAPPAASPETTPATSAPPVIAAPASPEATALRSALEALAAGANDEERNEHADLASFYEKRGYAPLWLTAPGELTPKASQLIAEFQRADEWGLDAHDFRLPSGLEHSATPEKAASAEIALSLTLLKYGRFARGGRIINPSEQLSSYLDRRPQLLKPLAILEGAAAADQPDAYLRGLHPSHPQFEKLRQKYLALSAHGQPGKGRGASADARRLLANMEEWRWMPVDLGDLYVWNNIPEYTQRVMKNGAAVRTERIIAGETGKQTPIFSRPLRKITFKPTWIVPDSIKVRELWPSLLKGGGLMREWLLEVRTKEGQPVNWRKINWSTADIRTYDVIQPNGPKSVMGKVKFSFPSQHTVFMHDTMERDKWMFRAVKRTFSHGCMRVNDPIGLARILLREDKGWDAAHVNDMLRTGPHNNEIAIERKIPVHITYFTALVDEGGKLHTFSDVYGHERRIIQALEGKWDQIVKGRDHLAPVELSDAHVRGRQRITDDGESDPSEGRRGRGRRGAGLFDSIFTGDGF